LGGQAIVTGDGTRFTTIADTSGPFRSFFGNVGYNDAGQVVFSANLAAGGSGVFSAQGGEVHLPSRLGHRYDDHYLCRARITGPIHGRAAKWISMHTFIRRYRPGDHPAPGRAVGVAAQQVSDLAPDLPGGRVAAGDAAVAESGPEGDVEEQPHRGGHQGVPEQLDECGAPIAAMGVKGKGALPALLLAFKSSYSGISQPNANMAVAAISAMRKVAPDDRRVTQAI
jgi:hypothetical protein